MLEGSSRTVLITAAAATLVGHANAFTAPSNFGVVRPDFSRPKKSAVYLSGFSPIGSIGLPKTPPTSGDAIVQDSLETKPVSDDKIAETITTVSAAVEEIPPPIETVEVPKVAAKITRNSSLRMDTISLLSYQMDLEKAAQITAAEIKFEEDTEQEEEETETNSPTPESIGMFFVNEILDDSPETSLESVEEIATETIVEELEDLAMEEIEETEIESVSGNSAEDIQATDFESEDSTENQEIMSETEEITGETLAEVTEEATVEVLEEKSVEEVIDEDKNDNEVIEQVNDIAEDTEDEPLETIVDEDTKEEELDTSDEITADVENALIALEAANKAIESTEKMLEKKTTPVEKEESTSQVTQYISKVSDNMKEGDVGERGEQFFIAQAFLVACIGLGTVPMVSGFMEFLAGPVLFLLGTGTIVSAVNELGDGLNPLPKPTSKTELTTTGAYSYVRHPIYSGLLADAFSTGIMTQSAERVLLTLALLAILNAKVEYEEAEMESSVEGYSDYKESVKGKFFPTNLIEDVFP